MPLIIHLLAEKSLCMIQWSFPVLLILDILIGRWHFDEQNNKCHCCGDRRIQYSKYPLKEKHLIQEWKRQLLDRIWTCITIIFLAIKSIICLTHIYHGAKVVFTKPFLYATLVWWLSTNSIAERRLQHRYQDFFFSRVVFLISTTGLRFVSVVLKVGDWKGP